MDDIKYYSQTLWVSNDPHKTTNQLHISLSIAKDQYGVKPLTIQLRITNFKNRINNSIILQYRDLGLLLHETRKFINQLEMISYDWKQIQKIYQTTIYKKKFMIFTSTTNEYNNTVQIISSNRGEDYLDSEKFFMTENEFVCFNNLLQSVFDQYILLTSNLQTQITLDNIVNVLENNNSKLTDIQRVSLTQSHSLINDYKENVYESDENVDINIINDSTSTDIIIQNELDDYISSELNNIEIPDIDVKDEREIKREDNNRQSLSNFNDEFTEKVLQDDVLNFETLIKSSLSNHIPILSLIKLIKDKINIDDLFPGCSKEEYLSIIYSNTIYLKEHVRQFIQHKKPLPVSVYPIRCNVKEYTEENKSLMYSLYSYMVCYSQIHNQLKNKSNNSYENKELYTFVLKVLTSPFIYTYIELYTKEEFINNAVSRIRLQLQRGSFENLFQNILETYGYKVVFDFDAIESTAGKTYDVIMQKWKVIDNDNFMKLLHKSEVSLLDWGKFIECSFSNDKVLSKFITLEFNHKINNGVVNFDKLNDDVKNTDDLSKESLNILGLGSCKYDTTNLIRFCDDKFTGMNECKDIKNTVKEIVNGINKSVNDIDYKHVDWNMFSDDILNAINCWNPLEDDKVCTNYKYFKDKISDCYLPRDIVIAMLKKGELDHIDDYSGSVSLNYNLNKI